MTKKKPDGFNLPSSEITPKSLFLSRRTLLAGLGLGSMIASLPKAQAAALSAAPKSPLSTTDAPTSKEIITTYNNFYEFGTGKEDPARNAHTLKTAPWSVKIDGLCDAPATIGLEDILASVSLEERIYPMRCVEGWSMVVPWIGFELGSFLKRFNPQSAAKYVAFETLMDPETMPGQKDDVLTWPYVEGLRLDEAYHPLTILAVGLYGETLMPQNGAPLRLVVPWKYGFKSIKSIVRMTFTDTQPRTSWNEYAPREYGFYSNVNPHVDHPRWSQARERRLGDFLRRDTLMFNGYEAQVGGLYAGMDLAKEF